MLRVLLSCVLLVSTSVLAQGFSVGGLKKIGTGGGAATSFAGTLTGTSTAATNLIVSDTPDAVTSGSVAGLTFRCANITATDLCFAFHDSASAILVSINEAGLIDIVAPAANTTALNITNNAWIGWGGSQYIRFDGTNIRVAATLDATTHQGNTFQGNSNTVLALTSQHDATTTEGGIRLRNSVAHAANELMVEIEKSDGTNLVTFDNEGDIVTTGGFSSTATGEAITLPANTDMCFNGAGSVCVEYVSANSLLTFNGYTVRFSDLRVDDTFRSRSSSLAFALYSAIDATNATTTTPAFALRPDIVLDANDLVFAVRNQGGTNVMTVDYEGQARATMCTGTGQIKLGGAAHVNSTAEVAGTAPDALMSYTLPANSLSTDGESIRITAWGSSVNDITAKTVTCFFGAQAVITLALTASQANTWRIVGEVVRTGAATQDASVQMLQAGTVTQVDVEFTTPTETLSGAVVVKCESTLGDASDITQDGLVVEAVN